MSRTTSSEFQAAADATKQFTEKPSDNDLLELYGLFKQATQNPSFDNAPKPGTFEFKAKAKYGAWKKVVDAGVTPEEAETKYIELVESFKAKYKYDPSAKPAEVGK